MIDSVSKICGISTFNMRALSRSICRKNCGLDAEKVVKTPVRPGVWFGLAGDLVGVLQDRPHVGAVAFLELHLEAAGIADAADRRRRYGDDEGFLDRLQRAEKRADDLVGGLAGREPFLERVECGKDDAGIAGVGEGGAGEAGEGNRVPDARRVAG